MSNSRQTQGCCFLHSQPLRCVPLASELGLGKAWREGLSQLRGAAAQGDPSGAQGAHPASAGSCWWWDSSWPLSGADSEHPWSYRSAVTSPRAGWWECGVLWAAPAAGNKHRPLCLILGSLVQPEHQVPVVTCQLPDILCVAPSDQVCVKPWPKWNLLSMCGVGGALSFWG